MMSFAAQPGSGSPAIAFRTPGLGAPAVPQRSAVSGTRLHTAGSCVASSSMYSMSLENSDHVSSRILVVAEDIVARTVAPRSPVGFPPQGAQVGDPFHHVVHVRNHVRNMMDRCVICAIEDNDVMSPAASQEDHLVLNPVRDPEPEKSGVELHDLLEPRSVETHVAQPAGASFSGRPAVGLFGHAGR